MSTSRNRLSQLDEAIQSLIKRASAGKVDPSDIAHLPLEIIGTRLTAYLSHYPSDIKFLPAFNVYESYATLKSANSTWQSNGRNALAVCALPSSTAPLERATGIKSVLVDHLLNDLQYAHRFVPPSSGKPMYVQRSIPSYGLPDRVVVPSEVNLIIVQPHALSNTQLNTLYDHALSVRGSTIFCDHPDHVQQSYPELFSALKYTYQSTMSAKLVHDPLPPYEHANKQRSSQSHESDLTASDLSKLNLRYAQGIYFVCHWEDDQFRLVAKLRADSVHNALSRTQHFGSPWPENPDVTCYIHEPRSTDVGDVIVHQGLAQRFEGNSFTPVPNPIREDLVFTPTHTPSFDNRHEHAQRPERPTFKIRM